MNEIVLAYQFLDGILAPDATLQGYAPGGLRRDIAPPGTLSPFVMMSLQSPNEDTRTITQVRILVRPLFQIRAVGLDSTSPQIASAASQIDVLLGGPTGLRNQSTSGGYVYACYRESTVSGTEETDGEKWFYMGGLYRLELNSTS